MKMMNAMLVTLPQSNGHCYMNLNPPTSNHQIEADEITLTLFFYGHQLQTLSFSAQIEKHTASYQTQWTRKKKEKKSETWHEFTSKRGLWDGSDICGLNNPDLELEKFAALSLPRTGSAEGKSLISQRVAASFLAETESSLSFGGNWEWWSGGVAIEGGVVLVFHKGTGVVDPAFFPTRIALLNRYFRTRDEEEEEEQPRFLILLTIPWLRLLLLLLVVWWRWIEDMVVMRIVC